MQICFFHQEPFLIAHMSSAYSEVLFGLSTIARWLYHCCRHRSCSGWLPVFAVPLILQPTARPIQRTDWDGFFSGRLSAFLNMESLESQVEEVEVVEKDHLFVRFSRFPVCFASLFQAPSCLCFVCRARPSSADDVEDAGKRGELPVQRGDLRRRAGHGGHTEGAVRHGGVGLVGQGVDWVVMVFRRPSLSGWRPSLLG